MNLILNKHSIMKLFLASIVLGVGVGYSKLYFFHFILFLVALYYAFNRRSIGAFLTRQPTRFHYFPLFMLGWYSFMMLWATNVTHALEYLFYIVCGIGIVLPMVFYIQNVDIQSKVFKILGVFFILEIIVSLLEVFTSIHLPTSPFSPYLGYFGRTFELTDKINLLKNMPTGFLWNPNDLAVALVIIFPFFLLVKNLYVKLFGIISIYLIINGAESRASLLAVILIVGIYIVLYSKKLFKKFLPILMVGFIIFPFYALQVKDNYLLKTISDSIQSVNDIFTTEVIATDLSNLDSVGIRKNLTQDAFISMVNSKGWGIGPGQSLYIHEKSINRPAYSMHNFWLELCVDGGIFFGLLFIGWYWYMVIKLYNISKFCRNDRLVYYAKGISLAMFGFFLAAISSSSVIYYLPMWLMYGFAITTINNAKRLEECKLL